MKKGLNTLLLIYIIVVATGILTFIVPAGEYQREIKNGKTVVVPNSYKVLPEKHPQGIGAMILAPIKGFEKAAEIIVFILIILMIVVVIMVCFLVSWLDLGKSWHIPDYDRDGSVGSKIISSNKTSSNTPSSGRSIGSFK